MMVGFWQLGLYVIGFGRLTWLFSPVLMSGYTCGASMHTFTSQIKGLRQRPWSVAAKMIEKEGFLSLFEGIFERCILAIARFGATLAMHDYLQDVLRNAGWLTIAG